MSSGARLGGSGNEGGSGAGGAGKRWWGPTVTAAASLAMQAALFVSSADAKGTGAEEQLTVESVTNALYSVAGPVVANLGFSGCVGVAAGLALKKVGQALAVTIGLAFMALQGLAYAGFITVNWSKVHTSVMDKLDLNNDGKVDEQDAKFAMAQGLGMLAQGVPSVAGFLAGFLMGLRM